MRLMARYEHLPIYLEAYDLTVHIEKIVRNFSRYHKYTLGADLRNKTRAVLEKISCRRHKRGTVNGICNWMYADISSLICRWDVSKLAPPVEAMLHVDITLQVTT